MVKLKGSIVMMVFVSLIGVFFLFAGIGTVEAKPWVSEATLKAIPDSYSGTCPAKIMFKGEIHLKGITNSALPFQVQYRFKRSDGASSPIQTRTFDKPVDENLEENYVFPETTWTLGDTIKLPTYDGWVVIEVISPQKVESNKANFKIQCKKAKAKEPPIKTKPQEIERKPS